MRWTKNPIITLILCLSFPLYSMAQSLEYKTGNGIEISNVYLNNGEVISFRSAPMFSFLLNEEEISSSNAKVSMMPENTFLMFNNGIMASFKKTGKMTATIEFINKRKDTITLENVVPFGTGRSHTYITSSGPWSLTRAKLYRPDKGPINVILPDNAWELGYGSFRLNDTLSVCGLCRRTDGEKAQKHRYKTTIFPGGNVKYEFHFELFTGVWQNGLKTIFQKNHLYDLDSFDNTLFEREDLEWVRHAYVVGLNFSWDKEFYDREKAKYSLGTYLDEGETCFGGYDIYALWPTWPRLGLDERNQWDLFRDLPGGLNGIRELVDSLHGNDIHFFICFNPWDESTRKEDPYKGIAAVIEATDADGVVLDCRGKSNERLQEIADSIKPGVIMYSEGMAVVKDMPGIVAGRVHNAIYYSPPLNLNKLIKPEFAIFRVCEPRDKDLKREFAIAFFNGYGTELNSMGPGRPEGGLEDLKYLGKTSMILRQNSNAFLSPNWTPLIPSLKDSIWVNQWPIGNKTLYTILSFEPSGYEGPLIEIEPKEGYHYISLWNEEEIEAVLKDDKHYLPVNIDPYKRSYQGTRREGNVDCIAAFPELIRVDDRDHRLSITASKGKEIVIWKSGKSYEGTFELIELGEKAVLIPGNWLAGEEKIIFSLFGKEGLLDEVIYKCSSSKPWLISEYRKTAGPIDKKETLKVKGGPYTYVTEQNDQFIPYPGPASPIDTKLQDFYVDKLPVSNIQFKEFLEESGYQTRSKENFLKHWTNGSYPDSIANDPVVYVDHEDALAYADWAGKRLPTELEWQYAMQKKNLETGIVWEMTNDRYDNGSHTFIIIKGGSYYKPESSWWYIQGGKQPPERQQMLLQVSPGFDRASTVGFRCVQDPR
ncbi:MAG: SUMF1/EgtB/PvdO family nonheme iron enzyme [Bacteroidetes bacterium]|nr:SUMF1/EgtB/PvdO family nonheme iron enzyme [Bacteroidota bacterium]